MTARWKHHKGDTYLPVTRYPQCSPGGPIWWATHTIGRPVPSVPQAIKAGIRAIDCDDFNIAVLNGGQVVAWLWGDEVIDEDAAFLAAMTQELTR